MIGFSTYIRKFTPKQRKQLEQMQLQTKIKTVPEILFYALDKHLDQQNEIARLERIIENIKKKL